jgi:ubiquinone/menaquinone biosynthesis C-methylase UbiE
MQDVLDKHYKRLATNYDEFLYYSPEFVRTLTTKMIEKLRLKPADTLADIGGGTGMYSLDILRQVPLEHPVICVDPYEEMLAQIPKDAPITAVAADAVEFSERPGAYNKVLIKETIHHVERKPDLFANLHRNLPDDGVLLLVHVPPDVKYPLFDKALERCLDWHADPDSLVRLLDEAGFAVERDGLDYRHRLPKAHYFRMVAGCYMSVLTSFSEAELAAGLEEMEQRYAGQDTLEFVDHFDYLTATPK